MRPLKLELEGFTAFRQKTCLDFGELDLFAITGPTGAGKSSLVDAIGYALYGRVPRVANEVGACISLGLPRMYVQLEFRAGDERYRVFRESRHSGQPNARLERFAEGEWRPLADRSRGVNERVQKIVGLDFDGFTRSVLLPQGQFQEFLAGSPDKRREVLRGLLRLEVYDRVRARASDRTRDLGATIRSQQQLLDSEYTAATHENLEALTARLAEAETEAAQLRAEEEALAGAADCARELARARGELLVSRKEVHQARTDLSQALRLVEVGDERIRSTTARLHGARQRIGANPFDAARFAALSGALPLAIGLKDAKRDLERAQEGFAAAEKGERSAVDKASNAAETAETARAARDRADEALHHAQVHYAAAVVQQGLTPGDECPVCGSTVGELPSLDDAGAFQRAKAEAERGKKTEEAARQAGARAENELAATQAGARAARAKVDDLAKRFADLDAQLAAIRADEDASPATIEAALAEQRAALDSLQRLQAEEKQAGTELDRLRQEIDEARQQLAGLQGRLASAERAEADTSARVAHTTGDLTTLAEQRGWADLARRLADGEDIREAVDARLSATRRQHEQLQILIGQAQQQRADLERKIETKAGIEADLQTLRAQHDVAADLAQMLRADKFQAFVQGEALAVLAADGSRRLDQLSGGRYRLCVAANSQDFEVVDQWNADDCRSVRTLSGGETFLASLALALTLAESLPGLAANQQVSLDSIFLDEGFGSLDPEALDRAADALDALRADGRLVCAITHLKELADRLPARVVVRKSEAGSSLEVA